MRLRSNGAKCPRSRFSQKTQVFSNIEKYALLLISSSYIRHSRHM